MREDQILVDLEQFRASFLENGYAVTPQVLPESRMVKLRTVIESLPLSEAVRRNASVYGVRNLLEQSPEVGELATCPELWQLATAVLGETVFATRATYFNKTADTNWALGWHRDMLISVREKIETPRFHPWARKAGIWHVQPPLEILSRVLALRIHLDDCGPENGALRVISGSHRLENFDQELSGGTATTLEVTCAAPLGGVVAMCPLTLHASSRAIIPANRRVIHIEYAAEELPNGLRWNNQLRPPLRRSPKGY